MSWSGALQQALAQASDQARRAAGTMISSAVEAGRAATNMASFAGRATMDALGMAGRSAMMLANAPYEAALDLLTPGVTPRASLVVPCPNSWAGKKARLEKRRRLISKGAASPDPKVRAAADRFAKNNDAGELARLSEDVYAQSPPTKPPTQPPVGWSIVSDQALLDKGVNPQQMRLANAAMYETPDDWPGGKKTVLAFRGTADLEDGLVDHDQAMGLETRQYEAAYALGTRVRKGFGGNVLVTGHSLGGGKAQAAGAAGRLNGTMFNAAGLNPDTVDGQMPGQTQFTQYRTIADPLTGVQNSPALQAALVAVAGTVGSTVGGAMKVGDALSKFFGGSGLSPEVAGYADKAFKALPRSLGNIVKSGAALPPAIGPVREVPAINDQGGEVSRARPDLQHSIHSVVNGIEREKSEDMAVLGAPA